MLSDMQAYEIECSGDENAVAALMELLDARKQIEMLVTAREKAERYEEVLHMIWDSGHNNDCLFCGFKDRLVKAALNAQC